MAHSDKFASARKDHLKQSALTAGKIKKIDKCNDHLLKLGLLKNYINKLELRIKHKRCFEQSLKELNALNLKA